MDRRAHSFVIVLSVRLFRATGYEFWIFSFFLLLLSDSVSRFARQLCHLAVRPYEAMIM